MEERNVIGGFMAAIMSNLLDFMEPLKWFLLLGFILIIVDLRFGIPFDVPILPSIVLLVVYGCEINSCYGNYFEAHGKKVKINIFKLFAKKADIIEVKDE